MTPAAGLLGLVVGLAGPAGDDASTAAPRAETFAALGDEAVHDLVILGETRPIILRVRIMVGERSLDAGWTEAARAVHVQLDRDHDGRLTPEEADKNGLGLVVAAGSAGSGALRTGAEVDVSPKDGTISVDELTSALRASAGPFRLVADGTADRRTDALFDQLDRDKDGQLSKSEMEAIVGSLHRLDRDANELIDVDEVNLFTAPVSAPMMAARPSRDSTIPPVLELSPDESPVRLARVLIKRYDAGSSRGPGRRDSKLSAEEFTISAESFALCDKNKDGLLSAEELRVYLTDSPRDAVLDVAFSADASGKAFACVRAPEGALPADVSVRQLSAGVVEIDIGQVRLDIHVDDGATAAETAELSFHTLFDAADANQDGYLEEGEINQAGQASPLTALFRVVDRDGDGKLYPRELNDYVAEQAVAARGRVTLTASNEGRALFGILDLDRDRRLGAREVLDTYSRVSACDHDKDGRVAPDEIPHHIQLTLTRGDLSGLLAVPGANAAVAAAARANVVTPPTTRVPTGPAWFRKMDRNRDGDVSPREFLGSRQQFDRLDLDHDGLLAPDEAEAATAETPAAVKGPGG